MSRTLKPQDLISHYRVVGPLGAGGMGEVYRARDQNLPRDVALKILPPELVLSEERVRRFTLEAESASSLNHPHIVTIYEIGEDRVQGSELDSSPLHYISMELVSGKTLAAKIHEDKSDLKALLGWLAQAAEGVAKAHAAGIVHRDLKPGNIMVSSDGYAKVLDFGLAKLTERQVSDPGFSAAATMTAGEHTSEGTALGTVDYMAPEQVRGQVVDARADVFSFGVILYEAATRTRPFTADSKVETLHRILHDVPAPVEELNPDAPAELRRLIRRCLAKDPNQRPQSMRDLALELRGIVEEYGVLSASASSGSGMVLARTKRRHSAVWVLTAATVILLGAAALAYWSTRRHTALPTKKEWILVAEFEGPAQDSALVAAARDLMMAALDQSGIVTTVPTDQIRLALARAGKPPSTRLDAETAREIAYRSSVRSVLEGRLGRVGRGFSIVVSLVDADSATTIASETGLASNEEALIPTLSRLARKIRAALGEHQSDIRATRQLVEVTTPSLEAYKQYIRGGRLLNNGRPREAIAVARSALALDPDFGPAWGQIGICFYNLGETDSSLTALDQALLHRDRMDTGRAMSLDALRSQLRGDFDGALRMYELGIAVNPQYAPLYTGRGACLGNQGRWEEALEDFKKAASVSPFGPTQIVVGNEFGILLYLCRPDEARKLLTSLPEGDRRYRSVDIAIAAADWDSIVSISNAIAQDPSMGPYRQAYVDNNLAMVHAARGQVSQAEQVFRRQQFELAASGNTYSCNLSRVNRLMLSLFTRGPANDPGDPGTWDTTMVGIITHGLWAAAGNDTLRARDLLARARARPAIELAQVGFGPALIAGWTAARSERWEDVIRELGPAALQGDAKGRNVAFDCPPIARWLVAEAYESLDRPDSAAAYFERAMSPLGKDQWDSRYCFSFAQRRLVLLYARMGRAEEARKHWHAFTETCSNPDPGMVPLVNEARAAMQSVEGIGRSSAR